MNTPASDATDRGQADEWSVDMTQPSQPPGAATEARYCCHCGQLTREPVKVAEAFSSSGAGISVYACPEDAPRYQRTGGES